VSKACTYFGENTYKLYFFRVLWMDGGEWNKCYWNWWM